MLSGRHLFFVNQSNNFHGNTMKTAHVAARRARVWDFSLRAAENTKTWPQVKPVNIPGLSKIKTPLHLNCSTSPRNVFGTGQLPFPNGRRQLRGIRGPETVLRRRFGDGHPILEDNKNRIIWTRAIPCVLASVSESTDTVNLPVQTWLYAVNSPGSSENLSPDSWKSVLIEQLIIAAQASVLCNLKAIILISTQEICFVEEVEYEAKQVSLCCHPGCVYMLIRSRSTNERIKKNKK